MLIDITSTRISWAQKLTGKAPGRVQTSSCTWGHSGGVHIHMTY